MEKEWKTLGLGFSSLKCTQNPNFEFSRGFLRADFDDLLSTVGPGSQLGNCSDMPLVCPLRISSSLGQRNDLWKEFNENRSVLATDLARAIAR